ncbi:hypothetical protein ACGFU4_32110 [Streptomyces sp. NPDC048511]
MADRWTGLGAFKRLNRDGRGTRLWDDIIEDLGSEYDAYSNVSSIGWTA